MAISRPARLLQDQVQSEGFSTSHRENGTCRSLAGPNLKTLVFFRTKTTTQHILKKPLNLKKIKTYNHRKPQWSIWLWSREHFFLGGGDLSQLNRLFFEPNEHFQKVRCVSMTVFRDPGRGLGWVNPPQGLEPTLSLTIQTKQLISNKNSI